jgi:hypothetical protein
MGASAKADLDFGELQSFCRSNRIDVSEIQRSWTGNYELSTLNILPSNWLYLEHEMLNRLFTFNKISTTHGNEMRLS